jgi:pimeloyl-ACP methyl ester carboxylesterase
LKSNITFFFRAYNYNEPTLVILHGLLGSSQNWQRAAKCLIDSDGGWATLL